jgi:hypothetical protein
MEAQATMLTEFDVRQVLPTIRVPTLLIHGTENPINPIGGARYMAERIPGTRLVELEGELHLPVGTALDRTLDEIESACIEHCQGSGSRFRPHVRGSRRTRTEGRTRRVAALRSGALIANQAGARHRDTFHRFAT